MELRNEIRELVISARIRVKTVDEAVDEILLLFDVSGTVCLHEPQYRTYNYDSKIERCDKCGEITN
jgi:hypothetical protein